MIRRACIAAGCVIATLACAGPALAQATFQSQPIGGRSALMGGTGIALGRDGGGPFLNPATITHVDDSGVAFSVNFYSFQYSNLTDFHQPGNASSSKYGNLSLPSPSLNSSRLDALPSTLCLFLTIGNWGDNRRLDEREPHPHRKGHRKLAACVASPERAAFGATASGYAGDSAGVHVSQATSVNQFWNRVYVGPSYSAYVSDTVALGASLHGVGTITSSTWSVDTVLYDTSGNGSSSSYATAMSAYSVELEAVLGMVWHIDDKQTLGLSLSTPSLHLFGHYDGTASVQAVDGTTGATLTTASGGYRTPLPIRVGAGLGAEIGRGQIEADMNAYIPVTYLARADVQASQTVVTGGAATLSTPAQTLTVSGRPIVDAGLGFETFLSPGFSLLFGGRTDLSAVDPLPASPPIGTLAQTRMQRVAGSFGLGSYGDGSELLFGTELSFGWGKSIAVDSLVSPPALALVQQRTFGAMLVVAGGVSLTSVKRTLRDLQNVVRIPAK